MELILNIILAAVLLVSGVALWQVWRILEKGKEEETITEHEADTFTRWLKILGICSFIAMIVMILRIFLPLMPF